MNKILQSIGIKEALLIGEIAGCLLIASGIFYLGCEDDRTESAPAASVAGGGSTNAISVPEPVSPPQEPVPPPSTITCKQIGLSVTLGDESPSMIDINDDNTDEVTIEGYTVTSADIPPPSADRDFFDIRGGTYIILDPFSAGMMISSNAPAGYAWVSPHSESSTLATRQTQLTGEPQHSPWVGPWAYVTNGYLPVQLTISGSVHYAWLRMSGPASDDAQPIVRVHDCAYETRPGVGIRAGQSE